jgi:hypothetical protein
MSANVKREGLDGSSIEDSSLSSPSSLPPSSFQFSLFSSFSVVKNNQKANFFISEKGGVVEKDELKIVIPDGALDESTS